MKKRINFLAGCWINGIRYCRWAYQGSASLSNTIRIMDTQEHKSSLSNFFIFFPASFIPWTRCNWAKKLIFHSLLLLTFNGSAQNIDTTYSTTYYQQKVTLFHLLPDTKGEIIFLGNSITDIGEWCEIWQNMRVKNRGISGDNTFGVLARLDEVVSSKPEKIFIMIGINDIAKNTPDGVILSNYEKIIRHIQTSSPKTIIYVQSILPTNDEFTDFIQHQNKDQHIRAINGELQKICVGEKLLYIDFYSRFIDAGNRLDKRYTNDGLHINGNGYMLWKKILIEKGYMK